MKSPISCCPFLEENTNYLQLNGAPIPAIVSLVQFDGSYFIYIVLLYAFLYWSKIIALVLSLITVA